MAAAPYVDLMLHRSAGTLGCALCANCRACRSTAASEDVHALPGYRGCSCVRLCPPWGSSRGTQHIPMHLLHATGMPGLCAYTTVFVQHWLGTKLQLADVCVQVLRAAECALKRLPDSAQQNTHLQEASPDVLAMLTRCLGNICSNFPRLSPVLQLCDSYRGTSRMYQSTNLLLGRDLSRRVRHLELRHLLEPMFSPSPARPQVGPQLPGWGQDGAIPSAPILLSSVNMPCLMDSSAATFIRL